MLEGSPKLRVKLLKSYRYRIEIDDPDMLSLGFLFEPVLTPPVDKFGLSPPRKEPDPGPTERQLAMEMLNGLRGVEDIDQKLADDPSLHTKMTDKCGDLLATCHYDKAKYMKWVEKNSWRPKNKA